ncbi:XTP/dITP diphosphatase [Natranaerobius trueperi]|uniref:dITP/XTP pyrophosphatase n=1 Tax=Natranaerobius trueperi TaxID=759412 RepID=A0A226BZI4_9FIRM|nr:XTP/dITP diphosphatase [Natranaerobius trueperi]OWZ83744.1 non-canonical purine NTP pyrophosphatase [Natranaerobius trueperi]
MNNIELILGSRNKGKVSEFKSLLANFPIEVYSLEDYPGIGDIEETGVTFKENALIKARTIANKTNKLTIADDSGLEVDALNYEPGVYSARYSGENASDKDNINKLLDKLKNIPYEKRTARFKCVMALSHPQISNRVVEGACEGYILDYERGNKGFGYDPVFYYPRYDKTFSELSKEEKSNISHRGKALEKLLPKLRDIICKLEG